MCSQRVSQVDSGSRQGTCVIVVERLGVTSETFIYRQIAGLRSLYPIVIAGEYINRRQFPLGEIPIYVYGRSRFHPARVLSGVRRRVARTLRSRRGEGGSERFNLPAEGERVLKSVISEHSPTVILAQFGHTAIRVLHAVSGEGVPVVAHFHGHDASRALRDQPYVERLRAAWPRLASVVCVSRPQAAALASVGCPPEKLRLVGYGVPVGKKVIRGHDSDVVTFLAVGRLVPKKGILFSLRAFANMQRQHPKCRLVVAGDGPLRAEARSLARNLGLGECVQFLGAVTQDGVCELLRRADVFVQHSVTAPDGDMEGLPVAILEAQQAGLPVVSTLHAGIPEEVIHERTGFLCSEGDVDAMSKYMAMLADDGELRQAMGDAGREHVIAHFEVSKQVQSLEDVLLDALKCAPRSERRP